jgi:hypothetical protein
LTGQSRSKIQRYLFPFDNSKMRGDSVMTRRLRNDAAACWRPMRACDHGEAARGGDDAQMLLVVEGIT